eukprot:g4888.t1
MFCKFLPVLIILCSLSCEKTQYNFFVGAIAAKSFVHFYILTTASSCGCAAQNFVFLPDIQSVCSYDAHHVVHGCNICRILSFNSSPCEALPRTACCFQMLFRPHQVPWTGFEGIMICLKDKVYHLQSHPHTILPTLRPQHSSASNAGGSLRPSTETPGAPDLTAEEIEDLAVYIRYDAPIQRRLLARKTGRTYTYRKRKKGTPREARINNVCKSLKELTSWTASQLEAFETSSDKCQYRIRGKPVCRKMFLRYYGIGNRTLERAMKLHKRNKSFYVSAGPISGRVCQDDWIYSLMFDYFERHVEKIADGIWHLQKQWGKEIVGVGKHPGPPPSKNAVKRVQKLDWSHVREMRVGEYGICDACWKLMQRRDKGFTGERDAASWKADNDLHHKIHQICQKAHQNRIAQAAVAYQWCSCITIDMSKPFYIPSARRLLDDFKNRHVMELNWGGSINFGGKVEYVLVHGPGIQHGANANITFLYHILRADLWDPKTMASSHLDLEVDGAGDNTAMHAQMFYCHLCKKLWKDTVCTNRCPRHHTHNIQDQRHYVTRYFGWNKTTTTTNLAQGLRKMLLGYKNSGRRVVLLLLTQNYDWEEYFAPCWNSNVKYSNKPLSWKYEASSEEGGMPTAEYKQQGDADPVWQGEGGEPGGPQLAVYLREPTLDRPKPLPLVNWVTEKKKEDLEYIFSRDHMSQEEITLMRKYMLTYEFTGIVDDGKYGDDGLPGKPAHIGPIIDRRCYAWTARDIRVLDDLPPDLWAVPPARLAAREDRDRLTLAEQAKLPYSKIYSHKPTPTHPKKYPGARAMTEDEQKEWQAIGVEKDPVQEIKAAFAQAKEQSLTEEKFGKMPVVTVARLKAYCRAHGLLFSGEKPALLARVWEHATTREPDSQADDSDALDQLEEVNALAGNSDFEHQEVTRIRFLLLILLFFYLIPVVSCMWFSHLAEPYHCKLAFTGAVGYGVARCSQTPEINKK